MIAETYTPVIDFPKTAAQISEGLPEKGPVTAFVPKNSKELQGKIQATGVIEPGTFTDCTMFNLSNPKPSEEKRRRCELPVDLTAAEIMLENAATPEEKIRARLALFEVDASYAQSIMVEAARQYHDKKRNNMLTDEEAEWLKSLLNDAQEAIYPLLDKNLADQALAKIHNPEAISTIMSFECRAAWNKFLHEKFDPVFANVYDQFDDEEPINGEKLASMTRAFMAEAGFPMAGSDNGKDGWKVVFEADRNSFTVESETKTIYTGNRKNDLDKLGFEKLMMHEVIVHARRAENGSRTGFGAFQKGLPGYNMYEEGLGILIEKLWSGEDLDQLSRDHFRYAITSYADGMYDDSKHTEQETYDFAKQLMDDAGVNDPDELYRHVMRLYRGMPEDCIMRSNASYLSGKYKQANLLQTHFDNGENS
jgi:hypothetical protein